MSKEIKVKLSDDIKPKDGYIIGREEISKLVGRVLTVMDAVGMPKKQEDAIRQIMINELWDLPTFLIPINNYKDIYNLYYDHPKEDTK